MTSLAIDRTMTLLADEVAAILGRRGVDAAAMTAGDLSAISNLRRDARWPRKSAYAVTADVGRRKRVFGVPRVSIGAHAEAGELIRRLGEELERDEICKSRGIERSR